MQINDAEDEADNTLEIINNAINMHSLSDQNIIYSTKHIKAN
jgi:hypothetical protein